MHINTPIPDIDSYDPQEVFDIMVVRVMNGLKLAKTPEELAAGIAELDYDLCERDRATKRTVKAIQLQAIVAAKEVKP